MSPCFETAEHGSRTKAVDGSVVPCQWRTRAPRCSCWPPQTTHLAFSVFAHAVGRLGTRSRSNALPAPTPKRFCRITWQEENGRRYRPGLPLLAYLGGNSCATLGEVANEAGLLAGYDRSETIWEHFMRPCSGTVHSIRGGHRYVKMEARQRRNASTPRITKRGM